MQNRNNILNIIHFFIQAILNSALSYINTKISRVMSYVKSSLLNIKNYTLIHAYHIFSMRGIVHANGYTFSSRSGMIDGRSLILMPIYVIISFLIVTSLFPTSMQQVTSAVTTSWSAAVSITYTQLLPILVILGIALHYIGIY